MLVARDGARLDQVAADLTAASSVRASVLPADLAGRAGCGRVEQRVAGSDRPVDPQLADDPPLAWALVTARDELREHILAKAVVRGRVVLSSGRAADYYVDLRRVTLDGQAAPLVGEVMLDLVGDLPLDAVGGLTLGADPVAAAMLHRAAGRGRLLDAFVVRKTEKAHGLQRRIEGPDVTGRRVLAVEDTSTTGASVLAAVEALRAAGAQVVAVAVIVDRGTGAREAVQAAGLDYRAAYGLADLGLSPGQ